MSRVPFRRFITTFLFFNKNTSFIVSKLDQFGYNTSDSEVGSIFSEMKSILPPKYVEMLDNKEVFDINDVRQADWLKTFGVFEYYDFIVRNKENIENPPEYFKWCEECMWIHAYRDVMVLVNILLFNDESLESISKVLSYKYKKKVGVNALELYKRVFWDVSEVTAKEALFYCAPFRNNALIIRKMRSGDEAERMVDDNEMNDGSDVSFVFHDASYIKWKIGYKDVEVPSSKNFLENVKKDSYFKYYETMNMTQSIEVDEESGSNDKLGAFDMTRKKRRNVEEQRVKMAKQWVDIFLKAEGSMPQDSVDDDDFFKKMDQLSLDFGDEKIARIDDMPEVMDDIKMDMN